MTRDTGNPFGPEDGFLAQASPRLRELLVDLSTTVKLAEDETLFQEGDDGDALFAVMDGALEVSVLSAEGRKLVLDMMRPGDILGEIALYDPGPRTATVTALEPSMLRRVAQSDLLRRLRQSPELAGDMLRLAGRRMRWMTLQIGDQVFLPVPSRLAGKLLYLTRSAPDRTLEMSQAQLGEFVGATREAVSKILSDWKRNGYVQVSRSGVQVLDRKALEKIAGLARI